MEKSEEEEGGELTAWAALPCTTLRSIPLNDTRGTGSPGLAHPGGLQAPARDFFSLGSPDSNPCRPLTNGGVVDVIVSSDHAQVQGRHVHLVLNADALGLLQVTQGLLHELGQVVRQVTMRDACEGERSRESAGDGRQAPGEPQKDTVSSEHADPAGCSNWGSGSCGGTGRSRSGSPRRPACSRWSW